MTAISLEPLAAAPRSVLHNMSCAPLAAVKLAGRDVGRRLRFRPPALGMSYAGLLRAWARWLGVRPVGRRTLADGLRELAADTTPLAALPPVTPALVGGGGDIVPGLGDDVRTVLAVLTRVAGHVFIRHKSPLVTAAILGLDVTLVVPADWRAPV